MTKLLFVFAVLLSSPAWAAPADRAPADKPWLGPALAIFFALCVALASVMKSRREHRD